MKKTIFNIAVFFKRPNVINRLFLLGGSIFLLTGFLLPDLKFNLQMKNPKKISIEEIKKTPKDLLPHYMIIENAQLMTVKMNLPQAQIDSIFGKNVKINNKLMNLQQESYNYVLQQNINKNGDTTISNISYPVYSKNEIQNNPNASSSDLTSYVIIQDGAISTKMLEGNKYFTDSAFSISGSFDGFTIDQEKLKILQDNGYKISKDAIVLRKDAKPLSLTASIVLSMIASFIAIFCVLSFFSKSLLCKIFGVEQEIIRIA